MIDPIDPNLRLIGAARLPDGIAGIEDAVLARLAAAPAGSDGRIAGALGIAIALILGIGGGMVGAGAASASAPLGMDGALAPSTLLLGR